MNPIFVRLLIFIYINQTANVRWNGEVSELFSIRNGCGQGKVIAALAYCLYVEELFSLLKRRRSGCWILGRYCGIFGYSDDNWLIAPSLVALQDMISTCQEFAASHNLKFSTDSDPKKSKTKCMAFIKHQRNLPNMVLCGNKLPWVESIVHLGTRIGNSCVRGKLDIKQKEALYIQKTCSINQEFSFAHPWTRLKLNRIYNCHYLGGQLWNIFGQDAQRFISTFNKSIKISSGLPLATHRYLLEPISGQRHMSTQLIRNFINFIDKIRNSSKKTLRAIYDVSSTNINTVTGSNLRHILLMTKFGNVEELTTRAIQDIRYREIEEDNHWRVPLIVDIVNVKHGVCDSLDGWTLADLDEILLYACTS